MGDKSNPQWGIFDNSKCSLVCVINMKIQPIVVPFYSTFFVHYSELSDEASIVAQGKLSPQRGSVGINSTPMMKPQ